MEQETSLDLRDIIDVLRKRKMLIIAITLLATLVSGILSFYVMKPVYEAKTSIIVGNPNSEKLTQGDVMMYQSLLKTYEQVGASSYVAEKTIADLNLNISKDQFIKSSKVASQASTQIIVLSYQSGNAEDAQNIVNGFAEVFKERARELIPTGTIEIMDKAQLPSGPVKPKKVLNVAIAFFLGLMVSIGMSFLMEYMDSTVKSEKDVEKYLELPVIGIIPQFKEE